jgi:hypothetical protein
MSNISQGPGWWKASDGKWYPPHLQPDWVSPAPAHGSPSSPALQGPNPARGQVTQPTYQRGPKPPDIWLPGAAPGAAPGVEPGDPVAPKAQRTTRNPKLVPVALAAVIVLAGGSLAFALTRPPGSSLAGKSPTEILNLAVAAANKSGAVTLTSRASLTSQLLGPTTTHVYIGRNGASLSVVEGPVQESVVLTAGRTYLKVTSKLGGTGAGLGIDTKYLGHWLSVPTETAGVPSFRNLVNLGSVVASMVALSGPVTETAVTGTSGSTVTLHGLLPQTSLNQNGGIDGSSDISGVAATLAVSTRAPFYPVEASYSSGGLTRTFRYLSWGKQVSLPSIRGAVAMPKDLFGPGGSPSSTSSPDSAIQSDLQTALTATEAFYTENNTFRGLSRNSLKTMDADLDWVSGRTASTGPTSISVYARAQSVVVAAWSPSTGDCLAIVNILDNSVVDGATGPKAIFTERSTQPPTACRAIAFAGRRQTQSSVTSATGFP